MITVITGMPGNGKTLYAVWLLFNAAVQNVKAAKEGKPVRPLYSDINGLRIDGVLPPPDDWRDTPDGSLVVYDEAHERFPSPERATRSGVSANLVVNAMAKHRHTGHDLVFISQWPNKLDPELRTLCGEHIHLNRAMGLQKAGLVRFARLQLNPYNAAARKTADEEIWSYPKDLYDLYDSATHHSAAYKFKLPARIRNGIITGVMIALILFGLYAFLIPKPPKKSEGEGSAAALAAGADGSQPSGRVPQMMLSDAPPPTGRFESASAPRAPRLTGYMLGTRCRVWDSDGFELDIEDKKCRELVKHGLPTHLDEFRSGPGMVASRSEVPMRGAGVSPAVTGHSVAALDPVGVGDASFRGQQNRYGQMRQASIPADYEGSSIR